MQQRILVWFITVLAALAVATLILYPKWIRFWEIDSCLDAGGRWDYDDEICETSDNPGDWSPYAECIHYGGEWDSETDVCIGAVGDPWPPAGGFKPEGD